MPAAAGGGRRALKQHECSGRTYASSWWGVRTVAKRRDATGSSRGGSSSTRTGRSAMPLPAAQAASTTSSTGALMRHGSAPSTFSARYTCCDAGGAHLRKFPKHTAPQSVKRTHNGQLLCKFPVHLHPLPSIPATTRAVGASKGPPADSRARRWRHGGRPRRGGACWRAARGCASPRRAP